jgi:hypothetical protein
VHTLSNGLTGVACRLDLLQQFLLVTPTTELGGPAIQGRLRAKLGKVRHAFDLAQRLQGRRQMLKLKDAGRLLGGFIGAVAKGERRGKIALPVGDHLILLATGAQAQLQLLAPR